MKQTLLLTVIIALLCIAFVPATLSAQPGTTNDTTVTGAVSRESFKKYKKAWMVKYRADSTMWANELAALKAGGTGTRTSPCPPTTAPSVTINLDSAAYAKLLDTLRKMGDKRWVNMPSFKNGVFAKLQNKVDSAFTLADENSENNATLNERVDKHAVRLNNAEDVIIGLNNKTDGNSDRISNLEIVVASEALTKWTQMISMRHNVPRMKICASRQRKVWAKCPYQGCKKSN